MAGGDMADLVSQHAREFGLGRGERDQAARRVDEPARQREGIDDVRIEHREAPVELGHLGTRRERLANPRDIVAQRRVRVFAAELRDDLRMLLAADPQLVLARHEAGEAAGAGGRVGRAGGELARRGHDRDEERKHAEHGAMLGPAARRRQASPAPGRG
jgi:hypothetical protein